MNPVPSIDDLTPSLQAKPKIVPPPMQPLPPVMSSIPTPTPSMPPPLQPLVQNGSFRAQQENALQGQIQKLMPHPSEPGFWHKLGHIAATIGNVAGDIVAPGTMSLIPGTQLGNEVRLSQDQRALAGLQSQDEKEQNDAARRTLEGAQAGEIENPTPKYTAVPTAGGIMEQSNLSPNLTPAGGNNGQPIMPFVKPPVATTPEMATYQGLRAMGWSPSQALQEIEKEKQLALRPPAMGAVTLQLPTGQKVAGKKDSQGNLLLADNSPAPPGSLIYQQPNYASYMMPLQAGRTTTEATQKWQQEAGQYQGTLNTLQQAKTGSELSASLVPLGLALTTPTAAGVHRINTAEIAQAGPQIGSIARRLDAALEKAGNGALPPDTIREAQEFVRMYQALKYHQYLAGIKQAADTFGISPEQAFVTSMDGQSEQSLADALKQTQNIANSKGKPQTQSEAPKVGDVQKYNGHNYKFEEDGQWHLQKGK